ncbi:MAG TPA: NAD(P)/FAD-dependent oxidoreductase [Thermomicrobiales bacterium]|nr:NAD(P)/FAD-dependent oxidoreductase [Thermomicrobiales bacterium]
MTETHSSKHVGVIGGGFAGLAAALRLAQAGFSVTLWEKGRLGGQAATFEVAGTRLEIFYHHLFQSDTSIAALAGEIGIGDKLMWLPSNVGYFADGRIYPLNGALDLLKLGTIPLVDRIRLGLVTAYLQRVRDWKKYENITAHDWLTKALGKRAYDRTLGAQLRAKFGRFHDQVPMVWFWGKIWLRTTSRRSPLDQEKLGYFDGSFQVMVDALVAACERAGVTIVRSGTSGFAPAPDGGWRVHVEGRDEPVGVDAVLATVPSHVFQRLAPELPDDYQRKLNALTYEAAVVAVLEIDRPLSDIYWLNIADDAMPFTGVIEHTNFVSPDRYQGRRFVYLSKYLEPDHPYFTLSDDDLLNEYMPHLERINQSFDRSWVKQSWVFRERAAQPIIPMRYSEQIPSLRTPLDGLYLANTTQIYPEDRGTNYSVRLGEDVAEMIIGDLANRSAS